MAANKNAVPPLRPKVGRQNALCERCKVGDHSGEHVRGSGCLEIVKGLSGVDWVCLCQIEKKTRPK